MPNLIDCIFCQTKGKISDEHIIPENIGGIIITRKVCKTCNDKLGSEVDSALNRHRYIYDAFKKIDPLERPPLSFRFSKVVLENTDGTEIKATPISDNMKIVTTKIGPDAFVLNPDDPDHVTERIERVGTEKHYTADTIRRKRNDFLFWFKNKKLGDTYLDKIFNIRITFHEQTKRPKTTMPGGSLGRFLSKACFEFAKELKIDGEISNLENLRNFARYGSGGEKIKVTEETRIDPQPIPIHLIAFNESQFQILFFGKYGQAINLEWRNKPIKIFLANSINDKLLKICESTEEVTIITDKTLSFIQNQALK